MARKRLYPALHQLRQTSQNIAANIETGKELRIAVTAISGRVLAPSFTPDIEDIQTQVTKHIEELLDCLNDYVFCLTELQKTTQAKISLIESEIDQQIKEYTE